MISAISATGAAYIAGIIDGEGAVTLTRLHRSEGRRPVVSISSTERPLLEYIRSTIGTGRITGKVCSKPHHSPSFTYTLSNRNALRLLEVVAPSLRTYKRARASLLLQEYLKVTPRNGRYSIEQRRAKDDFERRFLSVSIRAPSRAEPEGSCKH